MVLKLQLPGKIGELVVATIQKHEYPHKTQKGMCIGELVTNEILDFAKRNKKDCMVFKIDFARVYDCVDWNFLRNMLKSMGFGIWWMKWMESTVFTSIMSILVNGSPTTEILVSRGFRQGDPLSPFLFTIVAEGLTGMMRQAVSLGLYMGFKLSTEVEYNLL